MFVNKVFEDENFPADLILIQSKDLLNSKIINTSDEDIGICYIETKELDGEITLKYKEAPKELSQMFHNLMKFFMILMLFTILNNLL